MEIKEYIYLIRCENTDFYKIGRSKNPRKRLQVLQMGCPYSLILIFGRSCERAFGVEKTLHEKYWDRQRTGEWFELSKSEVENIRQNLSKK